MFGHTGYNDIIRFVNNYLLDRFFFFPHGTLQKWGCQSKKLLGSSKVLLGCVLKRLEARNGMHVLFPTAISHESQINPDFCK